jgi:AcrR family transcriptional regulator
MKSTVAAPRRTASTKVEQRQLSMELLLQAALRLFVSQGYRSTNLEQISSAAQLTKGAVYFYFRSKEAVLLELLKKVQHTVVDQAIAVTDATAGATATERLVTYVHYQANLGITHRDEVLLLILMALEFKEREGEVQAFIASLYAKQCAFIEALVRLGQERGEFRSDVPTRELAAMVLAINDGTFLEWYRRSGVLGGPDLVRALRSLVLGGLAVPAPAAKAAASKRRA